MKLRGLPTLTLHLDGSGSLARVDGKYIGWLSKRRMISILAADGGDVVVAAEKAALFDSLRGYVADIEGVDFADALTDEEAESVYLTWVARGPFFYQLWWTEAQHERALRRWR